MNEARVTAHRELMRAQEQIAHARRRRGTSDEEIDRAVAASVSGSDVDVYLDELTRYVAALGGHLEVRAVFPDETITLRR